MDLVQAFNNIGFTKHEANIYITLAKHGELTGYEVAKLSGISRSNVYASLSTLVEKGAANIVELSNTKYVATSKQELFVNIKNKYEENIKYISDNLVINALNHDPYVTILNYKNILNKLKYLITTAEKRIYISADTDTLLEVIDELKDVINRGLKLVIITEKQLDIDCIYYITDAKENFKLIADTRQVISGNLYPKEEAHSLYSKNKTLVNIIKESLVNEIELIKNKTKIK